MRQKNRIILVLAQLAAMPFFATAQAQVPEYDMSFMESRQSFADGSAGGGSPWDASAGKGEQSHDSQDTGKQAIQASAMDATEKTQRTGKQAREGSSSRRKPELKLAQMAILSKQVDQKNLPPTRLDSFVKNAGGQAEEIYGDEGTWDMPPYFNFSESHRIERGIQSQDLTTGHKSELPEAWGYPQ